MKNLLYIIILAFLTQVTMAGEKPLEKIKLQLTWKYQFEFAGFIAAKEKGFYKDAGFDVELLELKDQTNSIGDVLSGKTQYAVHSSSLAVEKLKGKDVVLLANYFKRAALVFLTKPDIYVPSDLVGKKIMGAQEQIYTGSLAWMLSHNGITKQDFTLIPHTYNTTLFEEGKIDAMTAYLSNEPYFLKKAKVPFNVLDPSNYGVDSYSANLFTSLDYADNNKEKVDKFLQASNRGWKYALENQSEVIDMIYNSYSQKKPKSALIYEAQVIFRLMQTHRSEIGLINKKHILKNISDHPLYTEKKLMHFFYDEFSKKSNFFSVEEQNYLKQKTQITMCVDPDWMPFEKIDNKKHIGMSSDYFKYFEKKLGKPIVLINTKSWSESLVKAKARKCDILSLAAKTPTRKKYWNFTSPYLRSPLVLVTSIDKPFINDITNVLDKPIGMGKNYVFTELLKAKHVSSNFIGTTNLKEGFDKVVSGEFYGYLDSLTTVAYELQKNYIGQLKISAKFSDKFNLAVAVRNDDAVLLAIFTKIVNSIPQNLHQKIANNWVAVTLEDGADYRVLRNILLFLGVVLVIGAIRYYFQKKYLSNLKKANKRILEQNKLLHKLSMTDSLTNIPNRLKTDLVIKDSLIAFNRYSRPFSLVMLDIDLFKKVNDYHGHLVGDDVLINVAKVINNVLRDTDVLGRWGGEEFLIVCPETLESDALIVGEKIRNAIRNYIFSHGEQITISAGVVQMNVGLSEDELLVRADEALYYSKSTGRDRVTIFSNYIKLK